jgi:RimK family alpha-L-glutamate ligase
MEPTTVSRGTDPDRGRLPAPKGGLAPEGGYRRRRAAPAGNRTGVVCVFGSESNATNVELVRRWSRLGFDTSLMSPSDNPPPGAVVLGRLDVLPTLDGIEPGLRELGDIERQGAAVVLNPAGALISVHDKLVTARRLEGAGLAHPRTAQWNGDGEPPLIPPVVLKPRFGSWGRDVLRCLDRAGLAQSMAEVASRPWFRRYGVLLQELLPSRGYDLRLIVAHGEVVGACERVAAPGEWRTNVSLGGTRRRAEPPPAAQALGIAAADVVGADLVGVDLLPLADGYVVLELNGAVEFDDHYSLGVRDVFLDAADALGLHLGPVRT